MSINHRVTVEIKDAMRSKDTIRLRALRGIRAAFLSAMKQDGSDTLSDDDCLVLLKRLGKQRKESIEAFEKGGRAELAAEEKVELAVIQGYLPEAADEATTAQWVNEALAATGATSKSDIGRVMGHLMKNHRADIDGKLANQLVAKALT